MSVPFLLCRWKLMPVMRKRFVCHLYVIYAMRFGYFVYLKQFCVNCLTNSTSSVRVFRIQQLDKLYESVVSQCIHVCR